MIRAQAANGTWETIGVDRFAGVFPQAVAPSWGASGPEQLTFTLRRPAHEVHADLEAFTPVEWHPGERLRSEPLWSGFVLQAPPGGGGGADTAVTCRGWHYYRDDQPVEVAYVHDNLADWVDTRSISDVNLFGYAAAGQVSTGQGVTFGFPQGAAVPEGTAVGVSVDLGPRVQVKRAAIYLEFPNQATGLSFYIRGTNRTNDNNRIFDTTGEHWDIFSGTNTGPGHGRFEGTFSVPVRYVHLIMYRTAGSGTLTPTGDIMVRMTAARLFTETAYESGGASIVKGDTIVKDLRDRFCPLLSTDDSRISTPSFALPVADYRSGDATPRAIMEAVNDYYGWRLGVDAQRRVFFRPQAAIPRLQVQTRQTGVKFRDTSTNDGSQIYNHVSARGKGGDGKDVRVEKTLMATVPSPRAQPTTDYAFTNPTGDLTPDGGVSATGWYDSQGVLAHRTTSAAHSGTYGAEIFTQYRRLEATVTGNTFRRGVAYRANVWVRVEWTTPTISGQAPSGRITARFGHFASGWNFADVSYPVARDPAWTSGSSYSPWLLTQVTWVPQLDVAAANVRWGIVGDETNPGSGSVIGWYSGDDASIDLPVPYGILDRRQRIKSFTLNVPGSVSEQALDSLATAFLLGHRTVPLKGTLEITAPVVEDLVTGQPVNPEDLGQYYGEMIRLVDVPDPDTGARGRDGIISTVSGVKTVEIGLDTERRTFEALISRLGVVQGA